MSYTNEIVTGKLHLNGAEDERWSSWYPAPYVSYNSFDQARLLSGEEPITPIVTEVSDGAIVEDV